MQLSQITHCLIHCLDGHSNDSQSGIIFANKFVLTHANILRSSLAQTEAKDLEIQSERLKANLKFQVINETNDENSLQALQCDFVHIFNCPNVENFLETQLPISGAKSNVDRYLLTRLIVLSVSTNGQEDFAQFFRNYWLENKTTTTTNRGDPIIAVTTPFGNECFFGTLNYGHISNMSGQDNCLLLLNIPLVYGSVGAGVFTATFELMGFVISSQTEWHKQKLDFAMAVSLTEVLIALAGSQIKGTIRKIPRVKLEDRVVLVRSGNSWATGCLVRVKNHRLILTCSHAIQNSKIECIWKQKTLKTELIFRNTHQVFDLAVISVQTHIPDEFYSILSGTVPTLGQRVSSAGFPVFDHKAIGPFISVGRVTKVKKGIFFTDASIQAGQSGSPFFDDDGEVVGIVVANAKNQETGDIFQKVNMAIPSSEFSNILEAFAATNDKLVLEQLTTDDKVVRNYWNMEMPLILSKL